MLTLLLAATTQPTLAQIQLTTKEFYEAIQDDKFDVIVDVRRQDEWDTGHVEGATFVMNLASTGSSDLLKGCETCTLGVYCRTGGRAGNAITRLINEGFNASKLYNGLGMNPWIQANYPVSNSASVLPLCSNTNPKRNSTTATSGMATSGGDGICRAVASMDAGSDDGAGNDGGGDGMTVDDADGMGNDGETENMTGDKKDDDDKSAAFGFGVQSAWALHAMTLLPFAVAAWALAM